MKLGFGEDFMISDESDKEFNGSFNFGQSYELPQGFIYESEEARKYLAGSYWYKTAEIEVYQVID
jgi:hypothetical protein